MSAWYPQDKKELNELLEKYLGKVAARKPQVSWHGLIVPHAGYAFSGAIAGKAYSLLRPKKAIILSPSHYLALEGVRTHNKDFWQTPFGKIKIIRSDFKKIDISKEHAIDNQIPFLQKLGCKEILPLLIGKVTQGEAKQIAEKIQDFDGIFIFSTDLSHFLTYDQAQKKDKQTIKAITSLDSKKLSENSACGIFPLLILIELCKLKNFKPKLITYKNSGDITGDKQSVVGYSSFYF